MCAYATATLYNLIKSKAHEMYVSVVRLGCHTRRLRTSAIKLDSNSVIALAQSINTGLPNPSHFASQMAPVCVTRGS